MQQGVVKVCKKRRRKIDQENREFKEWQIEKCIHSPKPALTEAADQKTQGSVIPDGSQSRFKALSQATMLDKKIKNK